MRTLLTFILVVVFTLAKGQNNFHKLYTVSGATQCSRIAMTSTGHGNAVLAYHYTTGANAYIGIQNVDTSGSMLWAKSCQLPTASYVPITMAGTPDSGAVLALEDTLLMSGIQLLKISKSGNIQWAKYLSATHFSIYPIPLVVSSDGNIFISNTNHDSLSLTKINTSGNIIWSKTYHVPFSSGLKPSAIVTNSTSIYMGGYELNSYSAYLVKTDTAGNILWQRNGFAISAYLNLTPAPSGDGIIVGTTNVLTTKIGLLDGAGTVSWDTGIDLRSPKMIRINSNSIALCTVDSNIIRTVIIDTLGTIQHRISYHDSLASDDIAIAAIPNQGFWISSVNSNKIWLMKADVLGNTSCYAQPFVITTQPDSFFTGSLSLSATPPAAAFSDIVLTAQNINVTDSTICGNLGVATISPASLLVFPNPVTDKLTIANTTGNITVTDVLGKFIFQNSIQGETTINTSTWQQGLYFIRVLDAKGLINTCKVMKL